MTKRQTLLYLLNKKQPPQPPQPTWHTMWTGNANICGGNNEVTFTTPIPDNINIIKAKIGIVLGNSQTITTDNREKDLTWDTSGNVYTPILLGGNLSRGTWWIRLTRTGTASNNDYDRNSHITITSIEIYY